MILQLFTNVAIAIESIKFAIKIPVKLILLIPTMPHALTKCNLLLLYSLIQIVTTVCIAAYYVNEEYCLPVWRVLMSNSEHCGKSNDCTLLFFILIFLLLFYDNSAIGFLRNGKRCVNTCSNNDSLLFFILVFLKLFYC